MDKELEVCGSVRCLRNDYMLNNSSAIIVLYDGKGGGAEYTIRKAKEKGLKIEIINLEYN